MSKVVTWTEDEDNALKAAWVTGASAAVIARQLTALFGREVTKNSIVGRAHRLKLASRASPIFEHGPAWTDEQDAQLRALWGRGITTKAVAKLMGRSASAVGTRARRLDLPVSRNLLRPHSDFRSSPRLSVVATTRPPQVPPAIPLAAGAGATSSAAGMPPEAGPQGAGAVSCSPGNSPAAVASTNAAAAGFSGGCRWPLWGNERPTHRYCDAPRRDVACSYCEGHAAVAFQRVAPTGSLAAWNVTERKFHRTAGQGGLTAGARFYA
jgi:GcrA cell cycle regulator